MLICCHADNVCIHHTATCYSGLECLQYACDMKQTAYSWEIIITIYLRCLHNRKIYLIYGYLRLPVFGCFKIQTFLMLSVKMLFYQEKLTALHINMFYTEIYSQPEIWVLERIKNRITAETTAPISNVQHTTPIYILTNSCHPNHEQADPPLKHICVSKDRIQKPPYSKSGVKLFDK